MRAVQVARQTAYQLKESLLDGYVQQHSNTFNFYQLLRKSYLIKCAGLKVVRKNPMYLLLWGRFYYL